MTTNLLPRTFRTAARASTAASVTMLVASTAHRRAPWAGINAVANVVRPGRAKARFEPKRTLLGLGLLSAGVFVMSALYESSLRRAPQRRGMLTASLFAFGGYAIDRWLMPERLLRDFERGMGPVGTFAKYAALGIAAAASRP